MVADRQNAEAAPPAKGKSGGGLLESARTIIIAFLVAIGIRTIAVEPFNIPSGSMIPTLEIGDYLFVSKFSYGYSRYSLPFGFPLFSGRILASKPKRGDVVVFKLPRDGTTDYIKRVIGLPGDRIQMKAGKLWINEQEVPRVRVEETAYTESSGQAVRVQVYIETLPNGVKHRMQTIDGSPSLRDTPVFTVPPDHYFMMGDNRDNSLDSRVPMEQGVGFVPFENLEGRAEFLFFSIDGSAEWWQIWAWPTAIRFSRLLNAVD